MSTDYSIIYVDNPQDDALGIIGPGVGAHNEDQVGESGYQRLCYVIQSPQAEIVGGLIAETYYQWCHIDLLWVKEELRGRGYGRRLVVSAEDEARRRGARGSYLDTFSFQAPEFYMKLGYEVFGQLPNCPQGHQRYFLAKEL